MKPNHVIYKKSVRILLFVILFGSMTTVQAQDNDRVDTILELYPKQIDSPEELAAFINRDFTADEDKVRAIYGWIINHIAYDPNEYKVLDYSYTTIKDRNKKQDIFRFKIIDRVLEQKDAVCEGYSMLFERLCELVGIQSYLVRGDSKASLADIDRPFKANHMWNIAFIEGKPYLFDPTWGAGKYNQKFIKDPTYVFYKTPPEVFLRTHYPVIKEDALLSAVPDMSIFLKAPILVDSNIVDASQLKPALGTLKSDVAFGLWEFAVPYKQEAQVSYSFNGTDKSEVESQYNDGKLKFTIPAQIGARLLIVYLNQDTALAYKVK
ncbi:MAG: transglutaminase domain-containing protein [Gilvibacter sp.]